MLNLFSQISSCVFGRSQGVPYTGRCSGADTLCQTSLGKWQGWTGLPLLLPPAPSRALLASCLHPGGLGPRPGWRHRSADCSQHGLAVEACPLAFTLGSRPGVVLTLASWDRVHLGTMPAQGRLQASSASPGAGIAAFPQRGWRGGLGYQGLWSALGRAKRNSVGPSVPTLGLLKCSEAYLLRAQLGRSPGFLIRV